MNTTLCTARECKFNDFLGSCEINRGLHFWTLDDIEGTKYEESVSKRCEKFKLTDDEHILDLLDIKK